jgi:hypothetical protein
MVAGAAVTAGKNTIGLPGCPTSCGRQPWFKLTCNTSYAPPVLFLHDHGGGPVEVLDISLDDSTLRVAGYRFIGGAPPLGLYLLGDRMLEWGSGVEGAASAERDARWERDVPPGSGHHRMP